MSPLSRTLIAEIEMAPDAMKREVLDFLEFLKTRQSRADESENLLPLAQTAWAAEWDSPEEDEAWRDL